MPENDQTSTAPVGAASVPLGSSRASVIAFAFAFWVDVATTTPSAAETTEVSARTSFPLTKLTPPKLWNACTATLPVLLLTLPETEAVVLVSSVAFTVSEPPATPSASWMPR